MATWARRSSIASARRRLDAREASFVKHGTTLVINALLQRAGARTALLTTKGFRDVLEVGRGNRTQPFNLRFHREPPLIPREWRFEVGGAHGGVGPRARAARDRRRSRRSPMRCARRRSRPSRSASSMPTSIRRTSRRPPRELRKLLPGVFVTTGSELTREWHEFERTATAAANAYVGPQVSRYIARVRRRPARRADSRARCC